MILIFDMIFVLLVVLSMYQFDSQVGGNLLFFCNKDEMKSDDFSYNLYNYSY